jgi:hypothetical protein
MPEIDVPIELFCEKCGGNLGAYSTATRLRGVPGFRISPCPTCLSRAEDDARDRGYREGFVAGYEDSENRGYQGPMTMRVLEEIARDSRRKMGGKEQS